MVPLFHFISRWLKSLRNRNPSISFYFPLSAACFWLSRLHVPSSISQTVSPPSATLQLSLHSSISCWPADWSQSTNKQSDCLCFCWVSWMFGIHHNLSPHVSSDFSLLPLLLSLFLLFPLRPYRRRSERWEVSPPVSLVFCLPVVLNILPHFLSFYFLLPLHLLLLVSPVSFHLYGSTSTSLSSLLLFFFYLLFLPKHLDLSHLFSSSSIFLSVLFLV